jgi:hypothetical protein
MRGRGAEIVSTEQLLAQLAETDSPCAHEQS